MKRARPNLKGIRFSERCLAVLILIALFLKLYLVFRLKAGWDEFHFLSHIYTHEAGTLASRFQTFHVHLFKWLPLVAENEIDQIVAARLALYTLLVLSCIYSYRIGRIFLNRAGALFAILCYLSFSNVLAHGASFRYDSICSFLFLLSLWLIICRPASPPCQTVAGLAMALSLLISIKAIFHLVTITVIFLALFLHRKAVSKQAVTFATALSAGTLLLHIWHGTTLPPFSVNESSMFLGNTMDKVLTLSPALGYLRESLLKNPVLYSLLLAGSVVYASEAKSSNLFNEKKLLPFTFLLPLLTLLVYRNAFPYYYVFILSPAVLLCGYLPHCLARDYRQKGSRGLIALSGILIVAVAGQLLFSHFPLLKNTKEKQREFIGELHKIFPSPVPYIDGCSAISTFPKVGIFMSSWGMEDYRDAGRPIMRELLEKHRPVFLLANHPGLDLSPAGEKILSTLKHPLFDEDRELLRNNFIPHWGSIYVAGKKFSVEERGKRNDFNILIPGVYTLEGNGSALVDDTLYGPDDTLELSTGRHSIILEKDSGTAILRWGDHLHRPAHDPPAPLNFYGF